jgi:hypothetical protein
LTAVVRAVADWQRTGMPGGICRTDLDEACRLLGSAWDEAQWARAVERLDQVGLGRLQATMRELVATCDVPAAAG